MGYSGLRSSEQRFRRGSVVSGSIVTGAGTSCGIKAASASGAMTRTGAGQANGVQARWQLATVAAQPPKAMAMGPNSTQAANSTRLMTRR